MPDNPFGIDFSPANVTEFMAKETAQNTGARGEVESSVRLAWSDPERGIWLYHADCLTMLDRITARYPNGVFDMIFADPPYFFSKGGITCHT